MTPRTTGLYHLLQLSVEYILFFLIIIMSHFEHNNIITSVRFGFQQKRSADLQLLQTMHYLALGLNERGQTYCILLDFSKSCFDKVSHCLLLLKLRYYRLNSQLIKWIASFLTNCTQQVVCDGSIS